MQLTVSRSAYKAMLAAAASAYPCEACGILLGERGCIAEFRETANVHPSPATHFEIDPQALIDAHREARGGRASVIGYFHSHPTGAAAPSETDRANAAGDGAVWAIAANGEPTLWKDTAQGFRALSYRVEGG